MWEAIWWLLPGLLGYCSAEPGCHALRSWSCMEMLRVTTLSEQLASTASQVSEDSTLVIWSHWAFRFLQPQQTSGNNFPRDPSNNHPLTLWVNKMFSFKMFIHLRHTIWHTLGNLEVCSHPPHPYYRTFPSPHKDPSCHSLAVKICSLPQAKATNNRLSVFTDLRFLCISY